MNYIIALFDEQVLSSAKSVLIEVHQTTYIESYFNTLLVKITFVICHHQVQTSAAFYWRG
jgi:hypothetical protein